MSFSRRGILRSAAYSAGAASLPLFTEQADAQVQVLGLLEAVAPRLMTVMWTFGSSILSSVASSYLSDWLKTRSVTRAPPPVSFGDHFDPPVKIHLAADTSQFQSNSTVNDRVMVVKHFTHITHTYAQPDDATKLNASEMIELSNKNNSLLYRNDCGCLIRVPVTSAARRESTEEEHNNFLRLAYNGGMSDPQLDYVRDFCGCDTTPMIGYGFRSSSNSPGRFAVRLRQT
jgi:hypothetical protein